MCLVRASIAVWAGVVQARAVEIRPCTALCPDQVSAMPAHMDGVCTLEHRGQFAIDNSVG